MPTVDGSQIQDFEALPAGDYNCRFNSWTNKEANAGDSTNAECVFVVDDGEYAGRKIFWTKSLKPAALWSFKQMAVALGAEPDAFKGLFDTDEILQSVQGNECRLTLSVNPEGHAYAGRNNVEAIKGATIALR